jgi:imidazolonepropionase-like amidohydrolase
MLLATLFLSLIPAGEKPGPTPSLLAIRVGKAETIAKGTIEHAVILIENGKIVTVGEDLPIERGIPILDRPEWTAMPGLVDAYSRMGLDGEGGDDMSPEVKASSELYPQAEELEQVLELGVTTLGLYPAGNGIPGQATAIRPLGTTREEMILADGCYLKIIARATSSAKKLVQDGFKKADEYAEKEKKAREKWEKDKKGKKPEEKKEEKKEEPKSSASGGMESGGLAQEPDAAAAQDSKPDEKKDEKKDDFVPPEPDAKAKPFVDLRAGKLRALVSINSSAEYAHFVDAIGKETFPWDVRLVVQRESDVFYVAEKKTYELDYDGIGDRKCRVVMEPTLSLTPGTMRNRNLAMELAQAGAKIVFIPRNDTVQDVKNWLANVGEMVGASLDRAIALRAVTLEPAELLGVEKRVGSIEKGKDANLIFFNGDPLEPSSRLQAVMLDGRFVHGEVKL